MKKSLTPLLLLALLLGCKTEPPDVATHYDAISGLRTDIMSDNLLETEGQPRELVYLNASRVFRSATEAEYYLEVTYMARADVGFLEILPGESLTVVVDGKEMKFRGTGSSNRRKTTKELVEEKANYEARKSQMQLIATGKDVIVKLQGKNGLIERPFKEANLDKFRKFVTMYAL